MPNSSCYPACPGALLLNLILLMAKAESLDKPLECQRLNLSSLINAKRKEQGVKSYSCLCMLGGASPAN